MHLNAEKIIVVRKATWLTTAERDMEIRLLSYTKSNTSKLQKLKQGEINANESRKKTKHTMVEYQETIFKKTVVGRSSRGVGPSKQYQLAWTR